MASSTHTLTVPSGMGYHMVQLKDVAPYEPFGYRKYEDITVPRYFFINRKQDRFTINCNYREHGVTKNGKKYGSFKTLFRFSVTLKKNKNATHPSLNVFYHGNIGGTRYSILNITREPAIVLGGFPTGINNLIIHEMLSLIKRQNIFTDEQYTALTRQVTQDLSDTVYSSRTAIKLIYAVAYPLLWNDLTCDDSTIIVSSPDAAPITVKSVRNNYESHPPPVFASPLLRNKTINELAKQLHIHPENQTLFQKTFKTMNTDSLYFLWMTRGLVDAVTQEKILQGIQAELPHYTSGVNQWDIGMTGEYVPYFRSLIRTLNPSSRNIILQDPRLMQSMPELLQFWMKTTPYERKINLTHVKNLDTLKSELVEEVNGKKVASVIDSQTITDLIEWFKDDDIFKTSTWYKPALEGHYAGMVVWLPLDTKTGSYETTFFYGDIKPKSELWEPLFKNEHFISNKTNASGYHIRGTRARRPSPITLSPLMYHAFLTHLQSLTIKTMQKYRMDNTPHNRAFTSFMIILTSSYDTFYPYHKKISKLFTLHKIGLEPTLIEYAVTHNIPIKQVKEYKDIPLHWVEPLLGIPEGKLQ